MRKLASFAIPFCIAIFAVRYLLPAEAILPLGLLCTLLSAGTAIFLRGTRRLRALLLCLGASVGLLWSFGYDFIFRSPARVLENTTADLTASVIDWPSETRFGWSVPIRIQIDGASDVRALFYAEPKYGTLRPGDTIILNARCRPSDVIRGEVSDAYPAKGIFLLVYPEDDMVVSHPPKVSVFYWPPYWAWTLKESIAALFPPDSAAFIQALVTGDTTGLSPSFSAALSRSGLAHTVAVSGLHVSFLAGLAGQLFGHKKRRAALVTAPLLLAFMLLAGCTPSVVRAVVMQLMLLIAPLVGRENDPPTTLSLALMLLLLQNPYAAASVSLQLSFASVAGILAFTGPLTERMWSLRPRPRDTKMRKRPLWKWGLKVYRLFTASIATTLGAVAFTTPLVAFYFGSVSLIAPISNLLSLWAVSLCFMGGLLAAVFGLISPVLGGGLALLVTPFVRYLFALVPALASAPFAAVSLTSPYLCAWLVYAYAVLLLVLARRGERRAVLPVCGCVVTLCAALLLTQLTYETGSLTVTVLSVGQGQSVLLRAGRRTALVDCGGSEGNAGDIAADYLLDRGRDTLDLLILTHFHTDHANGVPELLERLSVSVLAVPDVEEENPLRQEILELAQAKGTQICFISEDRAFALGPADLTLYAPLGAGDANEEGLSVLCNAGDFNALLTGDMEGAIEGRLVKYGNLPHVSLLVAGHHGSKHSTSDLLLEAVTPETAVISSGYNTYGHPAPETLLRLMDAGADLYRTDRQGNIAITVG